jgi:hypothetical protein
MVMMNDLLKVMAKDQKHEEEYHLNRIKLNYKKIKINE